MDFDVIIIGGGINGAGIARDASLRGLRVCLLEQGDLCGATSRWCSRLVHGGLRYLEFAEFGLVRESLHEREVLLRTAPHLVRPLPLLIPLLAGARRGPLTVRAGMWLYDLLSAGKSLPSHRMLDAAATRQEMPGLDVAGLRGAAAYHDAQVRFPERLVLENLLAASAAGAVIRLHTRVQRVLVEAGRVRGVLASDLRRGTTETLAAPLVVNAAGPWVDQLLDSLAGRRQRRFIGGSKGTHLVTAPLPGLGASACYAEAAADGRPFFIIPWNGMTLIGTTDIPFAGNPGEVRSDPAEVDYLLAEARRLFPGAPLSRAGVHYSYVGVRPLPAAAGKDQAAITRRHQLRHHRTVARGLYSVIGGKLTTYRSLAEQVVDRLARRIGRDLAECSTARESLPGALADPVPLAADITARTGLDGAVAARLVGLYGSRADGVAALVAREPALAATLGNGTAIAAEVVHAFEEEFATSLADCLMRRTMLGLGADLGASVLDEALRVAAQQLGWDAGRCEAERAGFLAETAALRLPVQR
ncbi:glycerol-3-phosphate dehydrogenase [Gammaproteobacteria bacterium]|nr:glycerol-3-phosphate dehydrogenase [Gammaproteobacteria bacterium]CAG0937848.1 glycerol-3-phosphate dehydrogenase [Gammaproteobacteria bacterium]